MEKVAYKSILTIFLWIICFALHAQDNPLQRRISIHQNNVPLNEALKKISQTGKFLFSYNASGIDGDKIVSVNYSNQSVRKILETLLGNEFEFKSGGSHIIIIPKKQTRSIPNLQGYTITGTIRDADSKKLISSVSIIEVGERNITSTNSQGSYSLPIKGNSEFSQILISRKSYRDTVIIVRPNNPNTFSIQLRPLVTVDALQPLSAKISNEIEENGLFRSVVSEEQQIMSRNIPMYEQRTFQASFLPILGTNKNYSGLVENHISLNLLGGYSMALSGFELAGLFNITRRHVHGAQIGGLMNITGGETVGWQLAGFMNNNMGAVKGVQTAGFYNLSMDSLTGVQASGFFNMARNQVRGLQTAGFMNISGKELNGVQAAGFMNLSGRDAKGAQIAGFCNLSTGDIVGTQASGFLNLSTGNMRGLQISGGVNVTVDTTYTMQVSGLANFARWIYGTQISLFNIAGEVGGSQIGLINYCDTVKGLPIGLISIVRKGIHQLEVSSSDLSMLNVTLRTGTHRLYNILSSGMFKVTNASLASFGYGIGTMGKHRRKIAVGTELVASLVFNESIKAAITPDFWFRLNPYLSYQPFKGLQLFAGPCIQGYRIDQSNANAIRPTIDYANTYQSNKGLANYTGWIGWQAGIRLF
jgi:hypothetical protein